MRQLKLIIAALFLIAPLAANADVISITYDTGGGVLTADFSGVLQGDNDTFIVSSVLGAPQVDGVDKFELPFVGVFSDYIGTFAGLDPAILSISGAFLDLIACNIDSCFDGFLFSSARAEYSTHSFGAATGVFALDNWSATVSRASVPEPGTFALLGLGLAGMGMTRRRKT